MSPEPALDVQEISAIPIGRELDPNRVYHQVYQMRTLATKLSAELAAQVERAAAQEKSTVSAFLRRAVQNEVAGREQATFGGKFGHLFGAGTKLPSSASQKEGYED